MTAASSVPSAFTAREVQRTSSGVSDGNRRRAAPEGGSPNVADSAPLGAPLVSPPTGNTGVGFYGFDWSATTHEGRTGIVDDALEAVGSWLDLPGKGLQGWSTSRIAYDREGFKLATVYYGGGREDVHIVSTSSVADKVRPVVAALDGARTSRVDTRVDSLVPFDDLAAVCEQVAAGYGSKITRIESSVRGESCGRTLYVGAPSSAVRVRLYEKWLESPGEYVEGTNRVEVQLRPASKVKERVSGWSAAESFCASRVTRALAQALGADLVPEATLHVARPTPDLEQTLEAMGAQYGRAVRQWLGVSGGDLGRILDYLGAGSEVEPPF